MNQSLSEVNEEMVNEQIPSNNIPDSSSENVPDISSENVNDGSIENSNMDVEMMGNDGNDPNIETGDSEVVENHESDNKENEINNSNDTAQTNGPDSLDHTVEESNKIEALKQSEMPHENAGEEVEQSITDNPDLEEGEIES